MSAPASCDSSTTSTCWPAWNGRHVLLIEDKTDTGSHDAQLKRYRTSVLEGTTALGQVAWDDLYPIYLRTGNHSLRDRLDAESEYCRVFDRNDFLDVLDQYTGTNAILLDFRDHLRRWQRETDRFREWTRDGHKNSQGWEGLYRWIEQTALAGTGDEWGPAHDPSGQLLGNLDPTERDEQEQQLRDLG